MTRGRPVTSRAGRFAVGLGLAYVGLGTFYIVTSGQLAAALASSVGDLEAIERWKGLGFVGVTGALLVGLSWFLFARIEASAWDLALGREAVLRADRHATPGLLAASIAHDFNNVLAVVLTSVDLLGPSVDAEGRTILGDLRLAVARAAELSKTLAHAGRSSASGPPAVIDPGRTVAEALALVRHHPKAADRTVLFEAPAPFDAQAHPTLVHQIVTNLVVNALDAVAVGGRVLVTVTPAAEGQWRLAVEDDGPGLDPSIAGHLFDPFRTTKPESTGLGLISVRTCAELHGGDVVVGRSDRLGGARFEVRMGTPAGP